MRIPSSELIKACRKSYGNTIRQTTPAIDGDRRRPEQSLRPGHDRQPLLDDLAAAGQARPAQEEREHDDEEDEQLVARPAGARRRVGREPALRLPSRRAATAIGAHREPGEAGDEEGGEAGEEGRGERGHDLERQRLGVEGDERRDEDAEPTGDHAGEHGVDHGQAARREPDEHRRHLVLRRRPSREAERRPAVQRSQQRRGDDDHDACEPETVLRHDAAEELDRAGRQDRTAATSSIAEDRRSPPPAARAGGRATRRASRAAPCSGVGERSSARPAGRRPPCRRASERRPGAAESVNTEVAGPERPEDVRRQSSRSRPSRR